MDTRVLAHLYKSMKPEDYKGANRSSYTLPTLMYGSSCKKYNIQARA